MVSKGKNRLVQKAKAISQDELQTDTEKTATPKKVAKWEYLDEIP